jgi:uncharacterized protein (DUF1684 family)
MMRKLILIFLLLPFATLAQTKMDSLLALSLQAQEELNKEYTDPETTILAPEDFKNFKGLEFYPIDSNYIVRAKFVRTPNQEPFKMLTTTSRLPVYEKYAEVYFVIDSQNLKLNVYQSHDLMKKEEYKNYLFMPFTDLTSGEESYGGGRYLELSIPEGDEIIIDFNQCYNPYCAYNSKYSCPIPPRENRLNIEIRAGVKAFH